MCSSDLNWIGVDCSADGRRMVAVVQSGVASGYVYQSVNGGVTWSPVLADAVRNWSCVTMSADGSKIVAAESPGKIWISRDSGATWSASSSPANANWSAITASADGTRLFACVDGGIPVISTDSGVTWTTTSLESRRWLAVAGSTDGQRLGVASLNGSGTIQLSNDGGRTWTAQSPTPSFLGLTMSSDGRRVYGAGYNEAIYTLNRDFTSYAVDADTGLIRDKDGRYISTSTNTSLAKVPSPLPLRLIVHNDAAAGNVTLLQRVFVGPGANSTNSVIATREALLDASQLASARRISAPHLPFSLTNTFWRTATTNFAPGGQVTLTVPLDYNDHASNPFLHTFHPDHDNLDAKFQTVLPVGQESYTVTREIKLTFTTADPNSFRSLTASASGRSGIYEETITMTGKAGATRQFRLSGSFNLQRISSVASLTTQ